MADLRTTIAEPLFRFTLTPLDVAPGATSNMPKPGDPAPPLMMADAITWHTPVPAATTAIEIIVDRGVRAEMLTVALGMLHEANLEIARLQARIVALHEARRSAA